MIAIIDHSSERIIQKQSCKLFTAENASESLHQSNNYAMGMTKIHKMFVKMNRKNYHHNIAFPKEMPKTILKEIQKSIGFECF